MQVDVSDPITGYVSGTIDANFPDRLTYLNSQKGEFYGKKYDIVKNMLLGIYRDTQGTTRYTQIGDMPDYVPVTTYENFDPSKFKMTSEQQALNDKLNAQVDAQWAAILADPNYTQSPVPYEESGTAFDAALGKTIAPFARKLIPAVVGIAANYYVPGAGGVAGMFTDTILNGMPEQGDGVGTIAGYAAGMANLAGASGAFNTSGLESTQAAVDLTGNPELGSMGGSEWGATSPGGVNMRQPGEPLKFGSPEYNAAADELGMSRDIAWQDYVESYDLAPAAEKKIMQNMAKVAMQAATEATQEAVEQPRTPSSFNVANTALFSEISANSEILNNIFRNLGETGDYNSAVAAVKQFETVALQKTELESAIIKYSDDPDWKAIEPELRVAANAAVAQGMSPDEAAQYAFSGVKKNYSYKTFLDDFMSNLNMEATA
jgi:hypothetical protein